LAGIAHPKEFEKKPLVLKISKKPIKWGKPRRYHVQRI